MTNKQKIAILKKMRALLKNHDGGWYDCFCIAFQSAHCPNEVSPRKLLLGVKRLGLRKPKRPHDESYWYRPLSPIRVKKIDQLIKRLSK